MPSSSGRDGFGRPLAPRPAAATSAQAPAGRPKPGSAPYRLSGPRLLSLIGFATITAIGVTMLALPLGTTGLVIGVFMLLVGATCLAGTAYTRVWAEGPVLHVRGLGKNAGTLRLDRISSASLTGFSRHQGPILFLTDRDGAALRIDATNLQLRRLYAELAQHLPSGAPSVNDRLERRLAKYRDTVLP